MDTFACLERKKWTKNVNIHMRNQNSKKMFECHQKVCGFSSTSCFFHHYRMHALCLYTIYPLRHIHIGQQFCFGKLCVSWCHMQKNRHQYAYISPGQWRDQKTAILEKFVELVIEPPLRRFPTWRLWSMEEDWLGPTDYVQYVLLWLSNFQHSHFYTMLKILSHPRMDLRTTYRITVFIFTH